MNLFKFSGMYRGRGQLFYDTRRLLCTICRLHIGWVAMDTMEETKGPPIRCFRSESLESVLKTLGPC